MTIILSMSFHVWISRVSNFFCEAPHGQGPKMPCGQTNWAALAKEKQKD